MVIQSRPSPVDHAPLDPSALADSLLPFGESRMLPRAAYVDPEVFAWEKRHFFGRSWMCVGRSEDVAKAGDQRAVEVGDSGVLLTRDSDGVLQDVHWYGGAIGGAFQGYTLGNILSAQFYEKALAANQNRRPTWRARVDQHDASGR